MQTVRRVSKSWLLMLFAISFVLAVSLSVALAGSHKPTTTYQVTGLEEPAKILVDRWGVPHIYAGTLYDVFFVQGFNAARDRLWQIDLWRRRGLGLLSEVLGPTLVEKDKAARLFLYHGYMYSEWLAYSSDSKRIAQAFVNGINEYVKLVKQNPQLLPLEFELLGYEPAFWSAEDVVRIRSHGLRRNVSSEVTRSRVVRDFGLQIDKLRTRLEPPWETKIPEGLDLSLFPSNPSDVLRVYNLATGGVQFTQAMITAATLSPKDFREVVTRKLLEEPSIEEAAVGSNNWAISPRLSRTKRPILENDPHRTQEVPSLRYISHLVAPGLDVIGAGEPALPGISIGHNERIAFGLTIFAIDQEDLYVYKTKPTNPNEYEYRGGWEKMEVVNETIPVKGGSSVNVELKFTRHGPVVYEDTGKKAAFAVRAAWLEPGMAPYFGSIEYMRAKNWDQFLAAMNRWGAPSENQVYADIDGNIGWKPGGLAPIRPNWDGLLPVPGDGRYEWAGFWDMDQLPVEYNPPRGWVASANQMNLPDGYPYQERKLGFDGWSSPFRYQRISEVLNSASKVTIEDMLKLKNDYLSIPARRIIGSLGGLNSADPKVSTALNMLRSWDFYLNADSAAAAIFQRWWSRLRTAIVAKMVDVAPAARSTVGGSDPRLILELVENPDSRLGPDPVGARNDAILSSLALAIVSLEGELGPNMETWTYGAIHSRSYEHALSDFVDEETRELIDVGPPFPRGGGGDSVGADGATWAMIVDVGQWDHSIAINTPGQSGNPYSPHYRDLFPIWAQNQAFPLLYTFGRILGETEQTIWLEPSKH